MSEECERGMKSEAIPKHKKEKKRENYTKSSKISNPLNQIELSILIFVWLDNHYLDDSKDYKGI